MLITVEPNEAQVLREILGDALMQLRIESARADSQSFREKLHQRERIVESLIGKVADGSLRSASAAPPH
ncbi:MAG: hypothetical protein E6J90_22515 [Deltaproteobacteria bacterium]|nr:MAG: hypothetical protein E6J91_23605 [Deltaproteobacteria bacterium]TMQ17326.1 MAG: hypothetical protein E6J90_22515 [Deltaproteobacteria bacterium]